ncbi:MAG: PQQ-binding-like beta-propeller repeat protein [Halobacteriaceae archaeon]
MPDKEGKKIKRRRYLASVGIGLFGGCSTLSNTSNTPTPTTQRSPTPTQTATSSMTPTETESPTDERSTTTMNKDWDGGWPMRGYDLGNTGYNHVSNSVTGPTRQWGTAVDGYYTLPTPAVKGASIFVGSDTKLYAIHRTRGYKQWTVDLNYLTHFFTPAVKNGIVYAAARDPGGATVGSSSRGVLGAIDATTGEFIWKKQPFISSSPKVANETLYYTASTAKGGYLRARNISDGSRKWSYRFGNSSTPSFSSGTPALGDGIIYATGNVGKYESATGRVVAINRQTQQPRWTGTVNGKIESGPVVHGDGVYVGATSGKVIRFAKSSGIKEWEYTIGDSVYSKLSMDRSAVYALTDGQIHAIDATNGQQIWKRSIGSTHYSTVSVTKDVVYVGGTNMYGFSKDGQQLWRKEVDGYSGAFGGPAIANGILYLGACIKHEQSSLYDNYMYRMT